MKLLIDDAHIDAIEKICELFPVAGVTTNPTILSRIGGNPFDTLKKIRELIGEEADLHVQAVSRQAEDIVDEANHIVKILGANTFVKIPTLPEGKKPTCHLADSPQSEAKYIAEKIKEIQAAGGELRDIAILYRAHYLTRSVEERLIKDKIPYKIYSGVQFFSRNQL